MLWRTSVRILILGGDGYLGWPTAMHLSRHGHDVAVADNFVRRGYDSEFGVESLVPIESLAVRVAAWRDVAASEIDVYVGDLSDGDFPRHVISDFHPSAVVHFAEQKSAPYSMIDREHAVHTQVNNVVGTLNLMYAIAETNPAIHLVKLGTMGRGDACSHRGTAGCRGAVERRGARPPMIALRPISVIKETVPGCHPARPCPPPATWDPNLRSRPRSCTRRSGSARSWTRSGRCPIPAPSTW